MYTVTEKYRHKTVAYHFLHINRSNSFQTKHPNRCTS